MGGEFQQANSETGIYHVNHGKSVDHFGVTSAFLEFDLNYSHLFSAMKFSQRLRNFRWNSTILRWG